MPRKNLFDGDSYKAQFAMIIYRRLMSRQWFTYLNVMADFLSKESPEELPCNVSNCDGYGELKKSFADMRKAIEEKVGQGCIEKEGNNRNKRFCYIGEEDDPLADMRNAKFINDLRQYWQFCQDSAGFFPTSWLEYFFKDCQDLLDIKEKKRTGEQVISSSLDRELKNIEFLPMIYEAIVNKQVLEIRYKPYGGVEESLIFHSHYLKEYNGRWFLFGHAEGLEPKFGYNLPLDRIEGKPRELYKDVQYVSAPQQFYTKFFNDIVGVTHHKDCETKEVHVRAHSLYMFNLILTLPIHSSQCVLKPFAKYDDGEYGEFTLNVKVNNEFIGLILQKGDGLEVSAPSEIREVVKNRIQKMVNMY